ncbi:MAG: transposase [Bacteroidia bacterium]|nr:transposase [Bacteroidia bacterium]
MRCKSKDIFRCIWSATRAIKDAKRICEYGIERELELYEMPDIAYFECRSLNNAIQDLTKEITKFTNRIHSLKSSLRQ